MFCRPYIRLFLLLLVLLVSAIMGTLFYVKGYVALMLPCLISALACGIIVVRLFTSSARKVTFMFDSIQSDDLAFRFTDDVSSTSNLMLNQALNRIQRMVLEARQKAREREKYFETILKQVNTGILVYNSQGIVFQVNERCLALLGITQMTHIRQVDMAAPNLSAEFLAIAGGESRLIRFYDESSEVSLNITAADGRLAGHDLKIVTLTDIADSIADAKMESWQRMSRVLTHEIMNSLAPITSLSETLLATDDNTVIDRGLEIIHDTSSGLTRFVDNYRILTRLPTPTLHEVDLGKLIKHEVELLGGDIEVTIASSDCILSIDPGMISQVVVNLLKNAREAVISGGRVWMTLARNGRGRLYIDVCNDGEPILDDIREDIFVPFFTTKEGGSGIGLSLSRQIMKLHEGALLLTTKPFTKFRIQF